MKGFCNECKKIKRVKNYSSEIKADIIGSNLIEIITYSCNHTKYFKNLDEVTKEEI